jgi:hypothetical protein
MKTEVEETDCFLQMQFSQHMHISELENDQQIDFTNFCFDGELLFVRSVTHDFAALLGATTRSASSRAPHSWW